MLLSHFQVSQKKYPKRAENLLDRKSSPTENVGKGDD